MRCGIEGAIARARSLYKSGEVDEAFQIADRLTSRHPEDPRSWALRAHLHTLAGSYERANRDLEMVIDLKPDDPYALFRKGLNYLELSKWSAAIRDFTAGMNLGDPDYESTFRLARAEAFAALGRKKEALDDLLFVPHDGAMWTYRLCSRPLLISELTGK